ncbi:restriction endonuclease subunit S [Hathewaya limosa]|uniref:Restriction endonuclease S subunit n=1 Tax=Hathewaya limosa TaxID=1536 RepID=A0ABU0JPY9_HATLI|nr:restriction endonuclease subunit S [Hathewaya limosa]MDQ0479143.1 restriction endonuclease S subunit [Hathewaya limosa]
MKLKEICILKSGFQGKTSEGNDFLQIRLKDVNKDGIIDYSKLESFNSEKLSEKYLLSKDDIILKAKSGDNTAAIIYKELKNTVATSHFIILTVKDKNILDPGYLAMYLNSEYAQQYLKKRAEGSVIPIIKIKALEEFDIKIIDLEEQKELSNIYKLMKKEKILLEDLVRTRENQFKVYLRNILD